MKKAKIFPTFVMLFLPFFVASASPNLQMEKAQAYLENQQYTRAYEIYENLLQDSSEPWQRAILMYNMGTVLLEEGKYATAANLFNAISYEQESANFFKYRVLYNLMLARIRQGSSLKENDPEMALKSTLLAQRSLPVLELIYCDKLTEIECQEVKEFRNLEGIIENQLAEIKQKIGEHRVEIATIPVVLKYMVEAIKQIIQYLDFLNNIPSNEDSLRQNYQKYLVGQFDKVQFLWKKTELKISENKADPKVEEHLELYRKAEELFNQGLKELVDEKIDASRLSLQQAIDLLKKLETIPPSSSKDQSKSEEEEIEDLEQKKQSEASEREQQLLQIYEQDPLLIPQNKAAEKKELRPW